MKPNPNNSKKITASSGNVFADLGLPNPEECLTKAKLAVLIGKLIDERRLTRAKAATLLGIDPPKISMLLNGRLKDFSVERLLQFLRRLNQDVEIHVRPHGTKAVEEIIAYV